MLDEDLEFIITNGWVEFGKLGYRSCPIEELRPYKEQIAKIFGIDLNKKVEVTDEYYFCEITDKNKMIDDSLESELWICWE